MHGLLSTLENFAHLVLMRRIGGRGSTACLTSVSAGHLRTLLRKLERTSGAQHRCHCVAQAYHSSVLLFSHTSLSLQGFCHSLLSKFRFRERPVKDLAQVVAVLYHCAISFCFEARAISRNGFLFERPLSGVRLPGHGKARCAIRPSHWTTGPSSFSGNTQWHRWTRRT